MNFDLTRPWSSYPIAVLDFEATSADPQVAEPVEVSVVRFEGGSPVARFTSLLRPSAPIPASSTEIHGITDEMVAGSPVIEDVAGEIAKVAAGAVPCAYNEPYDRAVLHRYITGTDVPMFDPGQQWLDAYVMVASKKQDRYVSGTGRLKLTEVCRRRGIIISDAHRAEFDAIATGKLLHMIMGNSTATLGTLLHRMAQARAEQDRDWAEFRLRKWIEQASTDELRTALNLLQERKSA